MLRPDRQYTVERIISTCEDDYDLAEEEDGFHCRNCGWRNPTIPFEGFEEDCCPECGSTDVENKLSTHIDKVKEITEDIDGFVSYSQIQEEFPAPNDRLDEALNHLLTRDDAYVVFSSGAPLVYIADEHEQ